MTYYGRTYYGRTSVYVVRRSTVPSENRALSECTAMGFAMSQIVPGMAFVHALPLYYWCTAIVVAPTESYALCIDIIQDHTKAIYQQHMETVEMLTHRQYREHTHTEAINQ